MDFAAPVLTLLALGTLCNGWMNMPFMLQLAYGRTGVAIAVNIVAVAIFIPALVVVTRYIGAMGAALIWLLLNAAYVAFAAPLMQRRLLRTTSLSWYIKDIFCPLAPAAIVAIGLSHAVLLNPVSESRVATGVTLVAIGVVITLISAIATELGRQGFARACRLVCGA
jgi:O-antigen/teichoic acid export membrane protein